MNMFEIALINKFRFPFKGLIATEDLFDLSVEDLDSIFKKLNSQIKKEKEESLLEIKGQEDKLLEIKIDIVKYIVGLKLEEAESRKMAAANKAKREEIMAIIASKDKEDLQSKSKEELLAMLGEI